MRVVVTGGAGYIGWSVVNRLLLDENVEDVVVYDNFARQNYGLLLNKNSKWSARLSIVVDDVLNSRALRTAIRGADAVCHLAALAPSPFSDLNPHAFDQVNNWGTAELCYAAEDENVPKIVYVSSGAVYGFSDDQFDLSSAPMPVTAYGVSKLDGERHVERLRSICNAVILRSGTVYGVNPVSRFDTFLNKFILDIVLNRPIQVHGNGAQHRPIIHVDSLAELVCEAIKGEVGQGTYNAVAENVTINNALEVLRRTGTQFDSISVNQQHKLRDLMIKPDARLADVAERALLLEHEFPRMLREISLT